MIPVKKMSLKLWFITSNIFTKTISIQGNHTGDEWYILSGAAQLKLSQIKLSPIYKCSIVDVC